MARNLRILRRMKPRDDNEVVMARSVSDVAISGIAPPLARNASRIASASPRNDIYCDNPCLPEEGLLASGRGEILWLSFSTTGWKTWHLCRNVIGCFLSKNLAFPKGRGDLGKSLWYALRLLRPGDIEHPQCSGEMPWMRRSSLYRVLDHPAPAALPESPRKNWFTKRGYSCRNPLWKMWSFHSWWFRNGGTVRKCVLPGCPL